MNVMERLSNIGILIVSFPEGLILTLFGIFSIGRFNYLENKLNYFKIALMSGVIAILSNIVRANMDNQIECVFINLFITFFLYVVILRLKFYESIMAAILGVLVISIVQTFALVCVTLISGISYDEAFQNDLKLFMFLLPERIIEIVIILFSHRFNLKIIDLESATAKRKEYIIQIVVYIISICTLLILSYTMVKVIINENNSITDSTNQVLLRINIYMALFVTFVLTIAMRSITEHYKKKNTLNNNEIIQSLDYIKGLIDDKDFIKAKNSIDGLKQHISEQNREETFVTNKNSSEKNRKAAL